MADVLLRLQTVDGTLVVERTTDDWLIRDREMMKYYVDRVASEKGVRVVETFVQAHGEKKMRDGSVSVDRYTVRVIVDWY